MQDWKTFCELVSKLATNFKGILSRVHGNFEEQNDILEPPIIVINYCIIIIIIIIINSYSYIF